MNLRTLYSNCTLCPRKCSVNRENGQLGYCGQTSQVSLARAALHYWEEPCISGDAGSGAVFFCGCNLKCVFCQNSDLATSKIGRAISDFQLAEVFLSLQEQKANNINLVTPGHFVPNIVNALSLAKSQGLTIPIVYNTGSYECVDTLKYLDGLVDIYLPDLKYYSPKLSQKMSNAADYFEVATSAIAEMYRQVGENAFDSNNLMKKGILIRHLVLPGHVSDSREILTYLHNTYGHNIYISIMNQFTPMPATLGMSDLGHTLKEDTYNRLINYCIDLGIKNAYIQEGETNKDSFIPIWDYTGVPASP